MECQQNNNNNKNNHDSNTLVAGLNDGVERERERILRYNELFVWQFGPQKSVYFSFDVWQWRKRKKYVIFLRRTFYLVHCLCVCICIYIRQKGVKISDISWCDQVRSIFPIEWIKLEWNGFPSFFLSHLYLYHSVRRSTPISYFSLSPFSQTFFVLLQWYDMAIPCIHLTLCMCITVLALFFVIYFLVFRFFFKLCNV